MARLEGKVVVLGATSVGKTSLVVRYMGKLFTAHTSPTIGASFFTCRINIGEHKVKLQVWDTAGQERFRSMAPMYYRNANAALLVFDLTNYQSFESAKGWANELRSNVSEPMVLSVVGNKLDLTNERSVSAEEAADYATSIGAHYFESSALEDRGVEQLFLHIAGQLVKLSGIDVMSDSTMTLVPSVDCSVLMPTCDGKTEVAPWSIDSVAHGDCERAHTCC